MVSDLTSLTASKRSLSLVCSPAHAHIVRIVISTGLPVHFLIIRIYWVAPRLLTRDSLSTDLHNDSFGESEYQVGSSAKILLQYP